MSMQATQSNVGAAAPRAADAAVMNAAPAATPALPAAIVPPAATPFATYWNARGDSAATGGDDSAHDDASGTVASQPASTPASNDDGDDTGLVAMSAPVLLPAMTSVPVALPMMPLLVDPASVRGNAGTAVQITPEAHIAAPQASLARTRADAPESPLTPLPGNAENSAPSLARAADAADTPAPPPASAAAASGAAAASAPGALALPAAALAAAQPGAMDDTALPARLRAQADAARSVQMQAGARGVQALARASDGALASASANTTSPASGAPASSYSALDASAAPSANAAPANNNAASVADVAAPGASATTPAGAFGMPAPASAAPQNAAPLTLAGAPQQWQQSLREALGERLQTQIARHGEQAVIRLDPPNLGRIEIAIRHSAGMLEVNLSATHGEVLRQLHTISDNVRQDLARGPFSDVALVVSGTPRGAQAFGDGGGRQRQDARPDQQATPGRALSDIDGAASTFAMQSDRE